MKALLLLPLLLLGILAPAAGAAEVDPDSLLVGFREEASKAEVLDALQEADVVSVRNLAQIDTRLVRLEDGVVRAEVASELRQSPVVEYVEPNYIVRALRTPSDTHFSNMWGLHNTGQSIIGTPGIADADIDAPAAWDSETGLGGNVVVGVADTGIDLQHGDLSPNLWTNPGEVAGNGIDDDGNGKVDDVRGWNWVSGTANADDDHSHGTHVAGTIGARGDNAKGTVGVSWGARLAPLKVLNSAGQGGNANIAQSILYAGQMGMPVYNASLGGGKFSQTVYDALSNASSQNTLFVFAAGNDGSNIETTKMYPCSYDLPNVLCVASTTSSDQLSSFSNYGVTEVDLAAPGSSVLSTYPQSSSGTDMYAYLSGTSMATPHVAGAAALLRQADQTATVAELRRWILNGTEALDALSGKTARGRLNVYNSLQILLDENSNQPPSVVIETPESNWVRTSSPTWQFRTRRAQTTSCSLQLEGAAPVWQSCAAPSFAGSGLQHGSRYTLQIRVTNDYGATSVSRTFSVDTVAPTAPTITSGPPSLGRNNSVRFDFRGETDIQFYCYIYDWEGWTVCSGNTGIDGVSYDERNALPDGTHTFRVRQEDPAGNVSPEATYTFTVDTTPPPPPTLLAGPSGWVASSSAEVSFTLPEGTTAICQFNGVEERPCTSPWTRSGLADTNQSSPHLLHLRSEDAAGNVSTNATTVSWNTDTSAPVAPTVAGPSGQTAFENVSFDFSGENSAVFQCSLDSETLQSCGASASWENLSLGAHVLRVRQVDRAGNASPVLQRNFEVLGDGPELSLLEAPASLTSSARPVFRWAIADETLQTRCSISSNSETSNFGSCSAASEHQPPGALSDGNWFFRVRASDAQGSWTEKTSSFRVDTTAPVVGLQGTSGLQSSRSASFTFGANETATFRCSLDEGAWSACQSPLALQGLADGAHKLQVEGRDEAGNTQTQTRTWTVDATPPAVPVFAAGTPTQNPGAIVFSGEAGASFECSLGSEDWKSCSSPWSRTLADGDYTLRVRSTDAAGNVSNEASFSWRVGPLPLPKPSLRGPDALGRVWFEGAAAGQEYLCSWNGGETKVCSNPTSTALWPNGRYAYRLQIREGSRLSEALAGEFVISDAPSPPDTKPSIRLLSSNVWTRSSAAEVWISWPSGTRSILLGVPGKETSRNVQTNHTLFLPDGQSSGPVSIRATALGLGENILWQGLVTIFYDALAPVLHWANGKEIDPPRAPKRFQIRLGAWDAHSGVFRAQWSRDRKNPSVDGGQIVGGDKTVGAEGALPRWVRVLDRAGNVSGWERVR